MKSWYKKYLQKISTKSSVMIKIKARKEHLEGEGCQLEKDFQLKEDLLRDLKLKSKDMPLYPLYLHHP